MYSRIAAETFQDKQQFFKQRFLEKLIIKFIQHLPESKDDSLGHDSEAILKSLEAQHGLLVQRAKGIYSFSHLTVHEYFTAKYIVDNIDKGTLEKLSINHILDRQWREVFLLVASMLDEADNFLLIMKKEVDILLNDRMLCKLLISVKKSIKNDSPFPPVLSRSLSLFYWLNHLGYENIKHIASIAVDLAFEFITSKGRARTHSYLQNRIYGNEKTVLAVSLLPFDNSLALDKKIYQDSALNQSLDRALHLAIKKHIIEAFQVKGVHSNEWKVLNQYLEVNRLLLDCLNYGCYITKPTRAKIINSLFTVPSLR